MELDPGEPGSPGCRPFGNPTFSLATADQNAPSFRQGMPESRGHGWPDEVAHPVFWMPAVHADMTGILFFVNRPKCLKAGVRNFARVFRNGP